MFPAVPSPADPSRLSAQTELASTPDQLPATDHAPASVKPEPRTVPLMPAVKAAEAAARAPRRFAGWVVRVQN